MGYPFNKIPFGKTGEYITTVVEIPKGSMMKVEWRRQDQFFALDRVEPGIFAKPVNYGFIPQTLDEDGDELDTLIVTEEPLSTGVVVEEATVIGLMNFEDDGEMDHKVIVVPADDRNRGEVKSYEEFGVQWQKLIEHHFNHYKDLKKPGTTKVLGFAGPEDAWKCIAECVERAQKDPWW